MVDQVLIERMPHRSKLRINVRVLQVSEKSNMPIVIHCYFLNNYWLSDRTCTTRVDCTDCVGQTFHLGENQPHAQVD